MPCPLTGEVAFHTSLANPTILACCHGFHEATWELQHDPLLKISEPPDRFPQAATISHEICMGALGLLADAQQTVHNPVPLTPGGTADLASL